MKISTFKCQHKNFCIIKPSRCACRGSFPWRPHVSSVPTLAVSLAPPVGLSPSLLRLGVADRPLLAHTVSAPLLALPCARPVPLLLLVLDLALLHTILVSLLLLLLLILFGRALSRGGLLFLPLHCVEVALSHHLGLAGHQLTLRVCFSITNRIFRITA